MQPRVCPVRRTAAVQRDGKSHSQSELRARWRGDLRSRAPRAQPARHFIVGNNPPSRRILNPFADRRNLPLLLLNMQFQRVRGKPRPAPGGGIGKLIKSTLQSGRISNGHRVVVLPISAPIVCILARNSTIEARVPISSPSSASATCTTPAHSPRSSSSSPSYPTS